MAQIPSLLLSIATAIIVTRVSSSQAMAEHISEEISLAQAWFPVAAVLGIIGLVPGMPTALFCGHGNECGLYRIHDQSSSAAEGRS